MELSKECIRKSIMYKIISLGYKVYIAEDDSIIIAALLCSNCNTLWEMSQKECMFCGSSNPHVYQCDTCGKLYSITNASGICCNKPLVKICINPNCITNTNRQLHHFLSKKGGVFEFKKTGVTLNKMRCKACGNPTSNYVSAKIVFVADFKDIIEENAYYIKRNSINDFEVLHEKQVKTYSKIEDIILDMLNIRKEEVSICNTEEVL